MALDDVFDACEDGDAPWLLEILDDGGVDDINATDEEGFSPLILAANYGHTEIIDILLERKANPNHTSNDGCTALLCAVQGGHVDSIEQIIKHKADVDPRTNNSHFQTPLYTASQEGHASIVKILLKAKAKVDLQVDSVTPLFISCQEGHNGCVGVLLDAGADCNLENKSHASPLFIAAQKGHTNICKKLLREAKIKVDDTTKEGTTPLLMAIQVGNLEEIELLLKAGADVELADHAGYTPLLTAATYGDIDAIETLVHSGVDLQKKDPEGRTAHLILKEEFGEDLLKIAGEHRHSLHRHATDLDAIHKAHRPTKAKRRRSNVHDRVTHKAHSLFAEFDVNNDKKLGEKELRQCLVSLGCEKKLGSKKFDLLLRHSFTKFDKSHDGTLDFEEFLRLYSVLMGRYKKMKRDAKKQTAKKHETHVKTVQIVTTAAPPPPPAASSSKSVPPPPQKSKKSKSVPPPPRKSKQSKSVPPPPRKSKQSKSVPPPPIRKPRHAKKRSRSLKVTQKPSESDGKSDGTVKLPLINNAGKQSTKEIKW